MRNHLTLEILGPQNWKQEYRVLYENISQTTLNLVSLTSRRKKVQRNLSVCDRKGTELAIFPSYIVEKSLCRICESYAFKAREAAEKERDTVAELNHLSIDFDAVFCHEEMDEAIQYNIDSVHQRINRITRTLEHQEMADRETFFYLNRVLILVGVYRTLYIPIVKLETPMESGEIFLLRYSVENLTEKSMAKRSFQLLGLQTLSLPLEVEETSNHVRIIPPKGTLFRHARITGLQGTRLEEKYKSLDKFLDDDMIYFHIPSKDANDISELKRESADKRIPGIEIDLGIDRNFPRRPSLMRILTLLMYMAVLVPSFALELGYNVDFSVVMGTLVLALTILISLGIYSIDKSFLHEYITAQIVICFLLFLLEICMLSILY